MATKIVGSCYFCGYPISAGPSQEVACPHCRSLNLAIAQEQEVRLPRSLVVGGLAFLAGMFFGPVIIASTEAGQRWLTEQVKRG